MIFFYCKISNKLLLGGRWIFFELRFGRCTAEEMHSKLEKIEEVWKNLTKDRPEIFTGKPVMVFVNSNKDQIARNERFYALRYIYYSNRRGIVTKYLFRVGKSKRCECRRASGISYSIARSFKSYTYNGPRLCRRHIATNLLKFTRLCNIFQILFCSLLADN
jgi:hypothetical protein